MDWSSLISAVVVALMAFLGSVVSKYIDFKGKKLEVNNKQNDAVLQCQKEHKADVNKVKEEFNSKLDAFDKKLDSIISEQMKMIFQVAQLQKDMGELKSSVGDIFDKEVNLEKASSAFEARLENLETHA